MSVAKGFHMSDGSVGNLDWNYVTDPAGSKSIIEEVEDVKSDLAHTVVIPKTVTMTTGSGIYTNNETNKIKIGTSEKLAYASFACKGGDVFKVHHWSLWNRVLCSGICRCRW